MSMIRIVFSKSWRPVPCVYWGSPQTNTAYLFSCVGHRYNKDNKNWKMSGFLDYPVLRSVDKTICRWQFTISFGYKHFTTKDYWMTQFLNICNGYFRWRAVSFRCGEHGVRRRSVLPVRLPHGSGVRDAGYGVPGSRRCLSVRAAEEQAAAAARQQSARLARQSVAHHRPEQSQQPVRLVLRQDLSKKQTRFLLNGSTKLAIRLIDSYTCQEAWT